jgi:hypothetical protein
VLFKLLLYNGMMAVARHKPAHREKNPCVMDTLYST